jgi:secondary thiamine-phosphate synthase enzyme
VKHITVRTTKHNEVVDITDSVQDFLTAIRGQDGACVVFAPYTTCALTTADLDPGTDQDYLDAFAAMFPKGHYRHPHNPAHVGEHIMSSLVGASVTIPVHKGMLVLGTWQRIVLVELSGPRTRELTIQFFPEPSRS